MSFTKIMDNQFPGYMTEKNYLETAYTQLEKLGFNGPNTIASVAVCRDELTQSFVLGVQECWGEAFNLSSLAGMVFAGQTGFRAALNHAPKENQISRHVFFGMAHISICGKGGPGIYFRPGQDENSGACGALLGFQNELSEGNLDLMLNPNDIEQSLLKQLLFKKLRYGEVPDLFKLTQLAWDQISEDMKKMLDLTIDPQTCHYAVLTGIQIHGPSAHYIWPGEFWAIVDGTRHNLLDTLEI